METRDMQFQSRFTAAARSSNQSSERVRPFKLYIHPLSVLGRLTILIVSRHDFNMSRAALLHGQHHRTVFRRDSILLKDQPRYHTLAWVALWPTILESVDVVCLHNLVIAYPKYESTSKVDYCVGLAPPLKLHDACQEHSIFRHMLRHTRILEPIVHASPNPASRSILAQSLEICLPVAC
ncbi:uncharacterized protein CC84DRAFT_749035 [Paraphaeosphaeria sporulosa]|uniref:Uncharacterized protein n=1 Tax=Paraphaeosphaeria sporulosa TaxID=1460663 RepID=A0A177CGM8_9PLEO|nr:uncharacterized protein CC84DRAFT_749035 [Paraphaeosphaeria sporulosa]OAG06112.1 hypothetical protein CC84DRAFT_749035 [Paraphaeosphaeria sporulosa]